MLGVYDYYGVDEVCGDCLVGSFYWLVVGVDELCVGLGLVV